MSEEWSDWIDHDGKGCPCRGKYVHTFNDYGEEWFGVAGSRGGQSWDERYENECSMIIRYRIRKPQSLINLINMAARIDEYA